MTTTNEWNAEEYLKKLHTKQLLDHLNKCRKLNGYYDITETGCVVNINQVKAELATREHVPTKAEAKVIRQNKAKKR